MIITDKVWSQIRERFTEEEKSALRDAVCGEIVCPRGVMLDETKLARDLLHRIAEVKRGAA